MMIMLLASLVSVRTLHHACGPLGFLVSWRRPRQTDPQNLRKCKPHSIYHMKKGRQRSSEA